jgi:3-phenylpropionate/trans-cinnamate dioxygenase ferredoxin subunit
MWDEVAKLDDIAAGGMKYVRAGEDDREICLCEYDGAIYAVSRRCGHENAPLADGALEGWIVTCPLHNAQFDIRSGANLSWPIDHDMGPEEDIPEPVKRWFKLERRLQWKTRVHDLHTYEVRVRDGAIEVDV